MGAALIGAAAWGCGGGGAEGGALEAGRHEQRFVNGEDDRREYFELSDPFERAALEQFTVVLTTEGAAEALVSRRLQALPTWRQVSRLCDGEPFMDQPAAAFCSGVLLDSDLVLTSGHCVDAVPLDTLRVAFDYYYTAEGELAVEGEDVYAVEAVLAARRDDEPASAGGERLDYAWLQLSEPALGRRPARAHTRAPGAERDDPVISIGAGGGVPLKWDAGGRVQDTRAAVLDYFIADTDTSQGSSGGGVFDQDLAVLGSLARGAVDFTRTDAGCFVTATEADPAEASEQFTYVHRAVEGLCESGFDTGLCDDHCEQPCDASTGAGARQANGGGDDGCALAAGSEPGARRLPVLLALLGLAGWRRAGRRRGHAT